MIARLIRLCKRLKCAFTSHWFHIGLFHNRTLIVCDCCGLRIDLQEPTK